MQNPPALQTSIRQISTVRGGGYWTSFGTRAPNVPNSIGSGLWSIGTVPAMYMLKASATDGVGLRTRGRRMEEQSLASIEDVRRRRFEALFASCYVDLRAYARRRSVNHQDADDLVADVFTVAWRRIDDVPEGQQARLWLFGTARLVRVRQFRTTRRSNRLIAKLMARWRSDGSDWPMVDHDPVVRSAFASLSESDREVLALQGWEDLSSREIGAVLEITPVAARKRLERARGRMHAALAERGHPLARSVGERVAGSSRDGTADGSSGLYPIVETEQST